jgi:cellulose synthase operon protein YhjQ
MKIISVVSAKGGVGKTTVTATLAHALARQGARVLVLDLDPQNALGLHFGIHPNEQRGLSRATLAQQTLRSAVMESSSGAFIVPYGIVNEDDRGRFERHVETRPDWLLGHLSSLGLPQDTLVLLDTPPGPSIYMKQALHAANLVTVVTLSDAASYATIPMMQRLVQTYCLNRPNFIDCFYIVNQVDTSLQLSKDVTQLMQETFGDRVIGIVHRDQSVCEALAHDKSVMDYEPDSQASHDMRTTAERINQRLQAQALVA